MAARESDADWRFFLQDAAGHIDASRLAACFDGAVPASLSQQMLENERLRTRLSALVQTQYELDGGIDPQGLDGADRIVAMAGLHDLASLVLRAGAIWWSGAIAGTVLAKAVAALQQQLGDELVSYAIGQRDLTGPAQSLEPLDSVGERIEADGWRCLAAWCDAAPAGLGTRVRLRLPEGTLADQPAPEAFRDKGIAIIRRAAA
jgi:hypothetical protein